MHAVGEPSMSKTPDTVMQVGIKGPYEELTQLDSRHFIPMTFPDMLRAIQCASWIIS